MPFKGKNFPPAPFVPYEGFGGMFEGDSADMCAGKFPLVLMGGRVEGLACADPGARTPIGASGNLSNLQFDYFLNVFGTKTFWVDSSKF